MLVFGVLLSMGNGVHGLASVEWRWMSGASTPGQIGTGGAAGQYASGYSPGARYVGSMTTAYNNYIYLFGGEGYSTNAGITKGRLNDVWAYRQTCLSCQGEWAFLGGNSVGINLRGYYTAPTPYPGSRWGSSCWFKSPNLLHIQGGYGIDGKNFLGSLSDLWSFNTDTYVWAFLKGKSTISNKAVYGTKGTPSGTTEPGALALSMLLTSKTDGKATVFGGTGFDAASDGELSDTWRYDSGTNQWTWINGPGVRDQNSVGGSSGVYSTAYYPSSRQSSAVMDTTSRNNLVYLFGGKDHSSSSLADLWAYNTVTNQWGYIAGESGSSTALGSYGSLGIFSPSNHPGGRYFAVGVAYAYSDLIHVYGGEGYDEGSTQGRLGDFWAFDTNKRMWSWISGYSVINQRGVYNYSGFSSSNQPGTRMGTLVSTNDALGLMYLFGGRGTVSPYYMNCLWASKSPPIPTPTPSPSTVNSAAYTAGIAVSITLTVVVVLPSIVSNVIVKQQKSDSGELLVMVVDMLQFVAITSQLAMPLPVVYREFASAFSWVLPVIKAPFDFVGKDASSLPSRRLLETSNPSLSHVFGGDAKQAALNFLPSLLFWTVLGLVFVMIYIFVVDRIRVLYLGHDDEAASFWRRSVGLVLRVVLTIYYALCYATFYALTLSLSHLGIFVIAILSLLAICISIPLIWSILLLRHPLSHEDLQIVKNRVLIAAFISGFKEDTIWFGSLFLIRKFVSALFIAVIPYGYVQSPLLIIVYAVMLFSLFKWEPYESQFMTRIWKVYTVVQIAELVLLFIVSFFVDTMDPTAATSISVVVIVASMIGLAIITVIFLRVSNVDKMLLKRKVKEPPTAMDTSIGMSLRETRL